MECIATGHGDSVERREYSLEGGGSETGRYMGCTQGETGIVTRTSGRTDRSEKVSQIASPATPQMTRSNGRPHSPQHDNDDDEDDRDNNHARARHAPRHPPNRPRRSATIDSPLAALRTGPRAAPPLPFSPLRPAAPRPAPPALAPAPAPHAPAGLRPSPVTAPPAPDAEPPACREKLSSFAHIVRRAMSRSLSRRAGRRVCRRRVSNGGSGARPGTREERDARRRPWPLRWWLGARDGRLWRPRGS